MALRGETIGTAYVRIIADGKDFDKSLQKELRKADSSKQFEALGKSDGKNYNEGFDDELSKLGSVIDRNSELAMGRGRFNALGSAEAENFINRFEADVRRDFGDRIGPRLATEMRNAILKSGTLGAVDEFFENIGAKVHVVTQQILADEKKAADEAEKFGVAWRKQVEGIVRENQKRADAEAKAAKDFETSWRKNMDMIDRDTDRILGGVTREVENWNTSFRRAGDRINRFGLNASKDIETFQKSLVRANRTVKTTGKDSDRILGRLSHTLFTFSDAAGTAFGRGSRNNFLNFFGSVVRNLSRLPGYFTAAADGVFKFVQNFGKAAEAGESGVSTFSQFGKLIGTGTAGLVAFGIAVGIVITVLGPLVSLVSTLAGAIVALVSSLLFASAAVGGVLLGAVLPLVAAVGSLVVAFTGLDKQMKSSLKEAFEPVVKVFKDMQEIAASNIFGPIQKAAPVIADTLKLMVPLVDKVTQSLGRWPAMFTKILQSPAFTKFNRQMGTFLPDAVDDLGRIFANVFKGMLGVFRSVLPITGEFFDWLVKITGEFRDFTNSAEGQKKLKEFFDDAADSAEAVLGFIDSLIDAIGDLAGAGRESGDTIFSDMEGAVRKFIKFLKENPDAVKQWFGDSVKTARSIGHAIQGLIDLFDKLDTPENRKSIQKFFDALGTAARVTGTAFKVLSKFFDIFKYALFGLVIAFAPQIYNFFKKVVEWVKSWGDSFADMKRHFVDAMDRVKSVIGNIRDFFTGAVDKIKELWGKLPDWFKDLGPKMLRAGIHIIGQLVKGLVGTVIDVTSIAVSIGHAIDDMLGGIIQKIIDALNDAIPDHISVKYGPDIPLPDNPIPDFARGGILRDPRFIRAGEDGPEAVVPLNRNLNMVDPSVRALSAIAQGLAVPGQGKTIEVGGITIITPTEDPRAVAAETVDQLAVTGYF